MRSNDIRHGLQRDSLSYPPVGPGVNQKMSKSEIDMCQQQRRDGYVNMIRSEDEVVEPRTQQGI